MKSPKKQKSKPKRVNRWKCTLQHKGVKVTCFATTYEILIGYKISDAIQRNFKIKCQVMCKKEHQITDQIWRGRATGANGEWVWWEIIDTEDQVKKAASLLGAIGGRNGTGKKKCRGDAEYYNLLRLKGLVVRMKNKQKKVDQANKLKYLTENVEN